MSNFIDRGPGNVFKNTIKTTRLHIFDVKTLIAVEILSQSERKFHVMTHPKESTEENDYVNKGVSTERNYERKSKARNCNVLRYGDEIK